MRGQDGGKEQNRKAETEMGQLRQLTSNYIKRRGDRLEASQTNGKRL